MKIFQPTISGSFTTSGSVFLKGLSSTSQTSIVTLDTTTGQLYYTASSAIGGTINTSSLVTTASFNSYTGSSSSTFAGTATTAQSASNFVVTNTLQIDSTLIDYSVIASTVVAPNNMFQQATGSYTSAHCRYTVYKGTNARAGEFVTVWNGTTVAYYDNATTDIGSTTDITFQSLIVTSQIQINAVAASSGWTVKALVTYL